MCMFACKIIILKWKLVHFGRSAGRRAAGGRRSDGGHVSGGENAAVKRGGLAIAVRYREHGPETMPFACKSPLWKSDIAARVQPVAHVEN